MASVFERAWYTSVRHADHLFHLQQPDAVIELIFRFVARTLGPGATDCWDALEVLNESPAVSVGESSGTR